MGSRTAPPVHVAVNAHLLSSQHSYRSAGVHHYIARLLAHLPATDPDVRYTAFVGEGRLPAVDGLSVVRSAWQTQRVPVRVLWEQCAQPWAVHRSGADLLHAPAFVGPLLGTCPLVVTVHDLSFLRYPALFRPGNRLYLSLFTRLSTRRARRVIAVSEATAAEIAALLSIPRGRIDVVYHGVEPHFRPLPPAEVAAFRQARGLPNRFILCVGTLEPRKNQLRLIEAYARLNSREVELVLVGGKGWYYEQIFRRVQELDLTSRVHCVGYQSYEELPLWYNAAAVFAYPSLYEGLGMPVMEAQACGTPVLTSNLSSLPEAGPAAWLVDPYSVEEIAAGLERLLANAALQAELRERGPAVMAPFTWQRSAQATMDVYRRALDEESTRP